MPAVAQINVVFANRQEFTELIPAAGITSVKSINPYTLLQYLLYDRESETEDTRIKGPVDEFYTYKGGVITAGDKINVKHSDFQITVNTDKPTLPGGNLDVENSIYVDSIYSRRKETGENYKLNRASTNRSVTISPRTDTATNNFFKIESAGTSKNISLFTLNNSSPALRNRIEIATTGASRNIILETDVLSISGNDTFHTGNITVNKDATFNRNVTIIGSDTASQEIFKITNSSGANRFSVDSANGNTDIQGTLNVEGASEIDDTLRVTGNVTFNETLSIDNSITLTNSTKERKRIIGVRRVDGASDIFSSTSQFLNDPIAIGDFAQYAFQRGMIIMWSGALTADGQGVLFAPTGRWALCDGQLVDGLQTPDLRERFIVGAGGDNTNVGGSTGYTQGQTGSNSNNSTLTLDNIPQHNHLAGGVNSSGQLAGTTTGGGNDGVHSHQASAQSNFRGAQGTGTGGNQEWQSGDGQARSGPNRGTPDGNVSTSVSVANSSHSHNVASPMESRGSASPTAIDRRPPWYAMAYIIKL
jgi:hypothetical protein